MSTINDFLKRCNILIIEEQRCGRILKIVRNLNVYKQKCRAALCALDKVLNSRAGEFAKMRTHRSENHAILQLHVANFGWCSDNCHSYLLFFLC